MYCLKHKYINMKDLLVLLVCILVFSGSIQAQSTGPILQRSWLWAKEAPGDKYSIEGQFMDISADNNGNTYVAGSFSGMVSFPTQPNPTTLYSSGVDMFITKYDVSGAVVWAIKAGGAKNDYGQAIKYDGNGNIYVVGSFTESADFGNGVTLSNPILGSTNVFIAKYDAATGNCIWARQGSGNDGYDRGGFDVTVDNVGDVYITGTIGGDITTFSPLPPLSTANRWWDIFVIKYNSAGVAQWQTQAGSTDAGYNAEEGNGIAVDNSGNVYITGQFNGSPTYPTYFGSIPLVSNGGGGFYESDYFLAKYNPSTNSWMWAVNGGGLGNDFGMKVSLDRAGSPYVNGYVNSQTATFGTTSITESSGTGGFVAKYSSSGTLAWIHPSGAYGQYGWTGSKVDANGNLYLSSVFSGTTTVGSETLNYANGNFYIANWNSYGDFQWVKQIAGTNGLNAIDVESNGNLDICATLAGSETFDCTVLNSLNYSNLVVAKLGASNLGPDAPTVTASSTLICPGASTTLRIVSGNLNNATEWKWYTGSCGGTLVGSGTSITVSPTQNTTYYVRGEGGCAGPGTCASLPIIINNTPPVINSLTGPIDPFAVNTTINLNVTYSGNSITQAAINWGDGTSTQVITSPPSTFTTPHTYSAAGVYTINLTLTDACGKTLSSMYQYAVVYDPSAGFVTGGGWINSPAGAYRPEVTLSGKANFGFESKYLRGATVPSGNTEFKFQVAAMLFKSTNYDWLVVAGSKAQYKGTGTINGSGNYGFLLTALDGNLENRVTPDLFRIKIWDKNNGDAIVYDNQYGSSDDAALTNQVASGSIVIHSISNSNTVAARTSIETELSKNTGINLTCLPNPSRNQFTLKLESNKVKDAMMIRITDILGHVIETRTNVFAGKLLQIGNNYRSGIYFIEVTQGNNKKQLKLIKL